MDEINWIELLPQIFYGIFLLIILALTRPVYADFRRRKNGYGVIFNSQTGLPIANAIIRLKNQANIPVSTAVADSRGRYRLIAPKGDYLMEVSCGNYIFPSKIALKTKDNPFFDNVLIGHKITISQFDVITKNIPLDSFGSEQGPAWYLMKVNLGKNTQHLLGFLGTGTALFIAIVQKYSVFPWLMFGCYLLAMVVRLFSFKPAPPPYGVIYDEVTQEPVSQAIIRLVNNMNHKTIEIFMTSDNGRFAFLVNKGSFKLMVEKKGYKKVIVNFPEITSNGFLLAKHIPLKQLQKKG